MSPSRFFIFYQIYFVRLNIFMIFFLIQNIFMIYVKRDSYCCTVHQHTSSPQLELLSLLEFFYCFYYHINIYIYI